MSSRRPHHIGLSGIFVEIEDTTGDGGFAHVRTMRIYLASEKQEFSDASVCGTLILVTSGSELVQADFARLTETARAFLAASKASSTRRAYAGDWRDFEAWCHRHAVSALPAEP